MTPHITALSQTYLPAIEKANSKSDTMAYVTFFISVTSFLQFMVKLEYTKVSAHSIQDTTFIYSGSLSLQKTTSEKRHKDVLAHAILMSVSEVHTQGQRCCMQVLEISLRRGVCNLT